MRDIIWSCWRYGVTPKEFLAFRMAWQDRETRSIWAGKLLIKELQHRLSTDRANVILNDKKLFAERFESMLRRPVMCLTDGGQDEFGNWLIALGEPKIVAKPRFGAVGRGVRVIELDPEIRPGDLRDKLLREGADMVEGYVEQHDVLASLYPGSVNTVRMITLCRHGGIEIIGSVLRFGISGSVDNMGAGGRAAPVNLIGGRVEGPAVTSNPAQELAIDVHPVTGTRITGFQIPMWEDVKQLAVDAASMIPEAGTVGWDIAISKSGPVLIEGNHDWDLILWQLPGQKGKRDLVERLLRNG